MSNEYQARKPANLSKINTNDYCELIWWSYILMVSPERLLGIVDKVGNSTEQVKKALKDQ